MWFQICTTYFFIQQNSKYNFWEISQVQCKSKVTKKCFGYQHSSNYYYYNFFIMHDTLVMHVCLLIFKVAFGIYRNHNCWKHVLCSWMLHFRQCCPSLFLVVMMAAKFKVALLLMILATEEYFTAALMWHLNLFWFWVRVCKVHVYCFIYSSHPQTPLPQWHEL